MATGILRIQSFAARQSALVSEVSVVVTGSNFNASRLTDEMGNTADLEIETPALEYSLDENNTTVLPYATCTLVATKPGYRTVTIEGVQIFPGQVTLAQLEMIPVVDGVSPAAAENVKIPIHSLFAGDGGSGIPPVDDCIDPAVLTSVVIPKTITVHLGKPAASAQNVTVSFQSYIANVASSEVYPTWPEQAIRANIHAQISLTLNRIYTEWYPSKGYNFDITNSTSYDQYYVHGRTVFDIMVRLTEDIFNTYVRKLGTVNPYFTSYCDGKQVTCSGMKQWGTVDRANAGLNALQILKYYYGNDIEIVRTSNIAAIPESYPGSPLRQGDSGPAVFTLQRQLNRIAKDYPSFGTLTVDGVFGPAMTETVKKFQKQFGLTADGVVGRSTWYRISYIYVSVKDLAELTSEGETSDGTLSDGTWGGTVLRVGSTGSAVEQVQFWLNTIAQYDSSIPSVAVDGVYGSGTRAAVLAFQRRYGLTADGVVGQLTWEAIYDEFRSIQSDNGTPNAYPGTPLRQGDRGQNVRLIQFWLKITRTVYSSLNDVSVDGIYGANTTAAVRRFQTFFGLTSDGVVGQNTWNKLYEVYNSIANDLLAPNLRPGEFPGTLRLGSTGRAVRELQFYLFIMSAYDNAVPSVNIDGIFGAQTEAAVKAYQRLAGLTVDGIVGRATWDSLYSRVSVLRQSGPVITVTRMDYPGTPLTVGTQSNAVLYYSLLLSRIAYYFESVESPGLTPVYTEAMADGTRSLQQLLDLPVTGVVDANTWAAAEALSLQLLTQAPNPDADAEQGNSYPAYAVQSGSSGNNVLLIQGWLNQMAAATCGVPFVDENSDFGASEEAKIRSFQLDNSMESTGTVDQPTWNALRYTAGMDDDTTKNSPCGC